MRLSPRTGAANALQLLGAALLKLYIPCSTVWQHCMHDVLVQSKLSLLVTTCTSAEQLVRPTCLVGVTLTAQQVVDCGLPARQQWCGNQSCMFPYLHVLGWINMCVGWHHLVSRPIPNVFHISHASCSPSHHLVDLLLIACRFVLRITEVGQKAAVGLEHRRHLS